MSLRALFLVALLAGCAQAPVEEPPAAPDVAGLELTDCVGWTVLAPAALGAGGSPVPAGWESADPMHSVRLEGVECQRVAAGPFERGPVRFVYDAHDRAAPPQACLPDDGSFEAFGVLGTLWIDDAALASFLADTYGMPTRAVPVLEQAQAGSVPVRGWSWGGSSAEVADVGGFDLDDTVLKLFWPRGDAGLGMLTVTPTGRDAPLAALPAQGQARAPMLLSTMPEGRFAGAGAWWTMHAAHGTFLLFRDTLCALPEA